MAATYLSIVNQVLIRLRETAVTTVAQSPYSLLIGALVNDAKREVEDSWQWSQIQDSVSVATVAGTYTYDMSGTFTTNRGTPTNDRARLWQDPVTSEPYLLNVTPTFESKLVYEPTLNDYAHKIIVINQVQKDIPRYYQVFTSPTITTAGQWNKQLQLFPIPDKVYNLKLYIVNPTQDMALDADLCLVPTAPIVLKAYLFALYERGEELGEMLTLTTDKVEQSLADAIAYDQTNSASYMALKVPYGAQY